MEEESGEVLPFSLRHATTMTVRRETSQPGPQYNNNNTIVNIIISVVITGSKKKILDVLLWRARAD